MILADRLCDVSVNDCKVNACNTGENTWTSDGNTEVDILDELDVSFPFDSPETEYLECKYCKENCNLLVRLWFSFNVVNVMYVFPLECVLGRHYNEVNGKLKEVSDCCYDITLLDSIQCVLRMDIVSLMRWMESWRKFQTVAMISPS